MAGHNWQNHLPTAAMVVEVSLLAIVKRVASLPGSCISYWGGWIVVSTLTTVA